MDCRTLRRRRRRQGGRPTGARRLSARGVVIAFAAASTTALGWAATARADEVALAVVEQPAARRAAAPTPQEQVRPPPLNVDYAQYGLALTVNADLSAGAVCGSSVKPAPPAGQDNPCILGSGGGIAIRGGDPFPGPWYVGGAYEFTKMDSANLYRLGIFQQLRFEMRYLADLGFRATPFATWGAGGLLYGNEWSAETWGALVFGGAGVELEVSRTTVMGVSLVYRPALIAGWIDTAGLERPTGLAQFLGLELRLEVRTELTRR